MFHIQDRTELYYPTRGKSVRSRGPDIKKNQQNPDSRSTLKEKEKRKKNSKIPRKDCIKTNNKVKKIHLGTIESNLIAKY